MTENECGREASQVAAVPIGEQCLPTWPTAMLTSDRHAGMFPVDKLASSALGQEHNFSLQTESKILPLVWKAKFEHSGCQSTPAASNRQLSSSTSAASPLANCRERAEHWLASIGSVAANSAARIKADQRSRRSISSTRGSWQWQRAELPPPPRHSSRATTTTTTTATGCGQAHLKSHSARGWQWQLKCDTSHGSSPPSPLLEQPVRPLHFEPTRPLVPRQFLDGVKTVTNGDQTVTNPCHASWPVVGLESKAPSLLLTVSTVPSTHFGRAKTASHQHQARRDTSTEPPSTRLSPIRHKRAKRVLHRSPLKWTKDSIFWLRFWANRQRQNAGVSVPASDYSYCYYNFFYYPLHDPPARRSDSLDSKHSKCSTLNLLSAASSNSTHSSTSCASPNPYAVPQAQQDLREPLLQSPRLTFDSSVHRCLSKRSSSESECDSATPFCVSTIMEVLPLLLLLTMGVVISTTCAKYTFHSGSPSSVLLLHNSSSPIVPPSLHSSLNESDYLMQNDEEHLEMESGPSEQDKSYGNTKSGNSQQHLLAQLAHQYSVMRLRWLSNSSVTCNDGTRAGYYVRHSPLSRRWLIYLEGGWYCMSKSACDQRWYKMREYMTSFRWSQFKTFNGILSSSPSTNPYWWNANHVFIPYCSSDIWSGDAAPPNEMAFLGSRILDEVIKELIRSPVYRFTDAKFVLMAGSSAGAAGVMINLDRIARTIAESGSKADVRGLADSGWILDSDSFQASIPETTKVPKFGGACIGDQANCSPTDSIRGAYKLWNSRVPETCAERYPNEPWRCFFGYRLYPTLQTPLFVVQFQYDEFQIYMDGMTSRALNDQEKMHYIRSLSEQIRGTLANVSAVYAPSCMSHVLLNKIDWHKVTIRGVSLPEALNCWENSVVQARRPGSQHLHQTHYPYAHYYPSKITPHYSSSAKSAASTSSHHLTSNTYRFEPGHYVSRGIPVLESKDERQEGKSENEDENELSQFYSSSASSLNLLNYLASSKSSTRDGNTSSYVEEPNMQHRVIIARSVKGGDQETVSAEPFAGQSNSITSSNGTSLLSVSNLTHRTPKAPSEPKSQVRKRKKRKRRKHHHRRFQSAQVEGNSRHRGKPREEESELSSGYQSDQSSGQHGSRHSQAAFYPSHSSGGKARARPYASLGWTGRDESNLRWLSDSSAIFTSSTSHLCQFRLIDDHLYPERNGECPRFHYKSYLDR